MVERSAVIKFGKHVASRVFSPDELESLDSYMVKYRKYGIVLLVGKFVTQRNRNSSNTSVVTKW